MAKEILTEGKIKVRRENREELLKIRKGEWEYDELIDLANAKMKAVEEAYENSSLPEEPNLTTVEQFLIEIREELYQS